MIGGAEKFLARGRELHDQGKYLLAQGIRQAFRPSRSQAAKACWRTCSSSSATSRRTWA